MTAPWWPVAAAGVLAAVAVALAAINWLVFQGVALPIAICGYFAGAIGPVILGSVYRAIRNGRRRHPKFRVQLGLDRTAALATALGMAAGLANAVLMAVELAK